MPGWVNQDVSQHSPYTLMLLSYRPSALPWSVGATAMLAIQVSIKRVMFMIST